MRRTDAKNQTVVRQCGGIPVLLDQVALPYPRVQLKALDILAVCSRRDAFRAEMMQSANFARVREMLSMRGWRKSEHATQAMRTALMILRDHLLAAVDEAGNFVDQDYIVPMLRILARCVRRDPKPQQGGRRSPSLPPLLCNRDETVGRIAELASVILHVCSAAVLETMGEGSLLTKLRESDDNSSAVRVLATLAAEATSEQTRFSCLGSLAVWAINGAVAGEIRACNGLSMLARALDAGSQPRIQQQAAFCLLNCAADSEWRGAMTVGGGLEALLRVLRMSPPAEVMDAVTAALRNLVQARTLCLI
jgi:hypothetical protein